MLTTVATFGLPAEPAAAQTPIQDGAPLCGVEAAIPGSVVVPDDGLLRIASFNVLHTQDDYADETLSLRVELLADALAASAADAVGIQEVVRSANHGLVAQRLAAALAARTGSGWSWCWYQSNPHLPGEPDTEPGGAGGPVSQAIAELARAGDAPWAEGLGVLARGAIIDADAHRLVTRAPEAPVCQVVQLDNPLAIPTCAIDTRQVLWARVETACGGLDLFTSHLANDESPITEQVRLVQITDAFAQIDLLATDDATPDVYVGDFNTLEGSPVWQAAVDAGFLDAFRTAEPDDPGPTAGQAIDAPGPTVTERIDYVFARPGTAGLAPTAGEVVGDSPAPFAGRDGQTIVWPSDHFGIAVTLLDESSCVAGMTQPLRSGGVPALAGAAAAPSTDRTLAATGGTASPVPLVLVVLAALFSWASMRRWRSTPREPDS